MKSTLTVDVIIPGQPRVQRVFIEDGISRARGEKLKAHAAGIFKELTDKKLPHGSITITAQGSIGGESTNIGTIHTDIHGLAIVHQHLAKADLELGAADYEERKTAHATV